MMSSKASATPASRKITHILHSFGNRVVGPVYWRPIPPRVYPNAFMKRQPFIIRARHTLQIVALALLPACASQAPAPTVSPTAAVLPTAPAPAAAGERPLCPPVQTCPACPACPATALPETAPPPAAPLQRASWADVSGWDDDDHAQAWPALRESCRTLMRQTRWQAACTAAQQLGERPPAAAVRHFFESGFEPWMVVNPDGTRDGLITGYYEPLIKGSRTRSAQFRWPIHGVPRDMFTVELADLYPDLRGLRLRGRIVDNKLVPYWTRAELEQMQDRFPAPTLLWASDSIDLFFLQVQGSGRVELPDGSQLRIGYADHNGHPYQSIGRWLAAQGELSADKASMEGIKAWARDNPRRLSELLNANPSYVFFRELPASAGGPTGALGVPLTEGRSVAVDPRTIPLGAPVFLATTWPHSDRLLRRLMLAQDTGGAIKGAVRADVFWGFGSAAGAEAGRMRQQGKLWVLLPREPAP